MKDFKERILMFFAVFLQHCMKFGLFYGTVTFVKIKFRLLNGIKLPNIKHRFKIRNTFADMQVYNQIFIDSSYEIDFDKPNIIIDAGANIGLFAILMANRFPDAKIICIEPDTDNFELLKENVSMYSNVFCENCGLWNKNTKLRVFDKLNSGKWGMIVEEDIENGTVPAISLDFLMEKHNISEIDLLKIDIETSEKQVFSDNYLNWLSSTKTLLVEFHDRVESGCFKAFINAVNNVFSDYDYSVSGENTIIYNTKLRQQL